MTSEISGKRRWYALVVLCLGVLMIVLDTTIVNVALPSIAAELRFSENALVWVVNAYMLTFAAACCSAAGSATCTGTGASSWPA